MNPFWRSPRNSSRSYSGNFLEVSLRVLLEVPSETLLAFPKNFEVSPGILTVVSLHYSWKFPQDFFRKILHKNFKSSLGNSFSNFSGNSFEKFLPFFLMFYGEFIWEFYQKYHKKIPPENQPKLTLRISTVNSSLLIFNSFSEVFFKSGSVSSSGRTSLLEYCRELDS